MYKIEKPVSNYVSLRICETSRFILLFHLFMGNISRKLVFIETICFIYIFIYIEYILQKSV